MQWSDPISEARGCGNFSRISNIPSTRSILHLEGHSRAHCNFAYSALACFRMGMSWSASFRWGEKTKSRLRKFLLWQPHFPHQLGEAWVRAERIQGEVDLEGNQPVVAFLI